MRVLLGRHAGFPPEGGHRPRRHVRVSASSTFCAAGLPENGKRGGGCGDSFLLASPASGNWTVRSNESCCCTFIQRRHCRFKNLFPAMQSSRFCTHRHFHIASVKRILANCTIPKTLHIMSNFEVLRERRRCVRSWSRF